VAVQPYLSELRIFSSRLIPGGWLPCDGRLLRVSDYPALFTLLGKTYGGDGVQTFALPDLRGRVPIHRGGNYKPGDMGGEVAHQLTLNEIPRHSHQAVASGSLPDNLSPNNNFWAANAEYTPYGTRETGTMSSQALATVGNNKPHNNMAPYLALNICIAVEGIVPRPDSKSEISDEWVGEIRILAGNVLPNTWLHCDGQAVEITKYSSLFSVVTTTYGGNGLNNFALPNLKARAALMYGEAPKMEAIKLGSTGGAEQVTLTINEMPNHTHAANASETGNSGEPANNIWARPSGIRPDPNFYAASVQQNEAPLNNAAISTEGGGAAHNNMMPYTTLNFCIATQGVIPPHS